MCNVSNVGKNICLQIDFEGGLFQILANEKKQDSFLVTLFCFCFQSHSNWMQNRYRLSGISGFAAKVSSASKLHILQMAVPCFSYFSGVLKTNRLLSNMKFLCLWFISLSPF